MDVNDKDREGKAPLHYIAEMEPLEALNTANVVLKAENVDVDIRDDQDARTPLQYAIQRSSRGLVGALMKAGADPNKTDKDWCNALFFATQIDDLVIMKEVCEKIQDPNFSGLSGNSPLHLAVRKGNPELVEYLLKVGGNPNNKDYNGRTPLLLAVQEEKLEIAEILLKNAANPNEKDENERMALHYAVNNSKPEQMFEMEELLIKHGANVNSVDRYGRTPLHYAFTPIKGNHYYHNQNDPVEIVTNLSAVKEINLDVKGNSLFHFYSCKDCIYLT